MSELIYKNSSEYRAYIQMSSRKRILVEGKSDKLLIRRFLDEYFRRYIRSIQAEDVEIDTAENLHFGDEPNNRKRVERIAEEITGKSYERRFIAFVDREFKHFQISLLDEVVDQVKRHFVSGRLLLTRGHSVENYFLQYESFRKPLRIFSLNEYFDKSYNRMEMHIDDSLRIACALGLAGYQCESLGIVRASVDWRLFAITEGIVRLDQELLKKAIVSRLKSNPDKNEKADEIINAFITWHQKIKTVDLTTVRWLCDGHTGMRVFWGVYATCVYNEAVAHGSNNPEQDVQNVLRADENLRFSASADEWIEMAMNNLVDYPKELFQMLDL